MLVGLIIVAIAIAGAVVLIVQNGDTSVDVHALGRTETVDPYWVVVAGLVIAFVGLLGLAIMRSAAARARRLRRERADLIEENERLSRGLADPDESPFFADDGDDHDELPGMRNRVTG